jgi:hypothetical protein
MTGSDRGAAVGRFCPEASLHYSPEDQPGEVKIRPSFQTRLQSSSGGPHFPRRSNSEMPKWVGSEDRFTGDYRAFRTASPIARVPTRSQPACQMSPVRNPSFNTFLTAFSIRAACSGRSSE